MALVLSDFQKAATCRDTTDDVVSRLGELSKWVIQHKKRNESAGRRGWDHLQRPVAIDAANCQPGGCLAVMVTGHGANSILADGFLLPLHWRTSSGHDRRVPPVLRQTADQVMTGMGVSGYSLHLMLPNQPGPNEDFLPDATDDVDSAFPALACGLEMLIKGIKPDYRTACTGKWADYGVAGVSDLDKKTRAVFEFPYGAAEKRIRDWFVPSGKSADEASLALEELALDQSSRSPLTLRTFDSSSNLRQTLAPLLARCGVCPPDDSSLAVLQNYYQWLRKQDAAGADDYYQQTLYQQICNRVLETPGVLNPRPKYFVTVVSSPALVGLADELFQFDRILILHTLPPGGSVVRGSDTHPLDYSVKAKQAQELSLDPGKCCVRGFPYNTELSGRELIRKLIEAMSEPIDRFLDGINPGQVMWDTTSGLRLFSHILEKRFARPDDWMLNLNHQWSAQLDHRIPCTESIVVWRHVTEGRNAEFS